MSDTLYDVTIANDKLSATILNFGARLTDLRLHGHAHSLVLGLANLSDHLDDPSHMGAIAGPVANRISDASATIAGMNYSFEANENDIQTLHGGHFGTGRQFWHLTKLSNTMVHGSLTQPDGTLGFPGYRVFSVIYQIIGTALQMRLSCHTDRPSWCNLAPHAYFNLDGSADIRHHHLHIPATHYLPVDTNQIPTGDIAPVQNTRFDFQTMRSLSEFTTGTLDPIDHNYCLATDQSAVRAVQTAATLRSEKSGIEMTLSTDQSGLQLYFSQFLEAGTAGQDGQIYGPFSGICLEPQGWPDAVNKPAFPSVEISPETPYLSTSRFSFTAI